MRQMRFLVPVRGVDLHIDLKILKLVKDPTQQKEGEGKKGATS